MSLAFGDTTMDAPEGKPTRGDFIVRGSTCQVACKSGSVVRITETPAGDRIKVTKGSAALATGRFAKLSLRGTATFWNWETAELGFGPKFPDAEMDAAASRVQEEWGG